MGRKSGRTLNPADQYRKEQHKKEKKKNKQDRKKVREIGSALKDTITESELSKYEDLEKAGKLDKEEIKKLSDLRERMSKINEIRKAHGIKVKPKKTEAESSAPVAVAEPARDPTRSIYYDPVMNPFGAPPPGQPYLEYPPLPTEIPFGQIDTSSQGPPKEAADSEQDSSSDSGDSGSDSDSDSDSSSSSESEIDEDDENFMPPLPEGPAPTKEEQERFLKLTKPKPVVNPRTQNRYQQRPYLPMDGRPPGMMAGPPGQAPHFNNPYGPPPGFRPPFNNGHPAAQPGGFGAPPPMSFPGYNGPPPAHLDSGFAPPGFASPGFAPPGFAPPGFAPPGFAPPGFGPPPDAFGPPGSHRPPMRPPSSYRPPPQRTPRPPRISNPQSDPMTGHLPMDEKEVKKQAALAEKAAAAAAASVNKEASGEEKGSSTSSELKSSNVPPTVHPLPPKPGTIPASAPGLPLKKPALVAGPTSISAQPQLRNLQKELVHLVPSTIMRKRVSQKGKIGKPVNAAPGVDDDDDDRVEATHFSSSSTKTSYASTSGLIPESIPGVSGATVTTGSDKNGVEPQEHRESSLLGLRLPRINLAPSVDLSSIGAGSMKLSVNSAPDVPVTTSSSSSALNSNPADREKKKKQEYDDFLQGLEGDGLL